MPLILALVSIIKIEKQTVRLTTCSSLLLIFASPQVLMVRFASLFNMKEQSVTFISGATYSLEELRAMGMSDLLGAMFDFSHKLATLELNAEELSLFTAVVLVSAGERRQHPRF